AISSDMLPRAKPKIVPLPVPRPAALEPEKMNTASIEQHDAISSDMPPRAKPKIVPLPVPRPAALEPKKMNTASVKQHYAISRDMPPRAKPKIVPLPVPRSAALAKVPTPKTAATVKIENTGKRKRPESTVKARPVRITSTTEKRGWVNFGTFKNGNWVEK